MNALPEAALLSLAYLGPARYFSKFILHKSVFIEACENYSKQSYRNRCTILSANGPLALSIPVKYSNHPKTSIREVRIDYDTAWNRIHWQAIVSAYRNSPFFEYYADAFQPFYTRRHPLLFDFNLELTSVILKQLGLENGYRLTASWEGFPNAQLDLRNSIHIKSRINQKDVFFEEQPYTQVFHSKYGFVKELSILDLLFNTGPEAIVQMADSIKKSPGFMENPGPLSN